jgi:pimeloyl-ACP methyl ester carboxylesterase
MSAPASYAPNQRPPAQQGTFVSFDGTPIGYQLTGNPDGIPLLLANGLGGNYSSFRFLIHRFWQTFRFISWDYRGIYTSGRPLSGYDGLSVEHNAKDGMFLLQEVLKVDRCFAVGWSKGVQVLLETVRHAPALFEGLVLHNGVAGKPYETLAGRAHLKELTPAFMRRLQRVDGFLTRTVRWAVEWPWLIPVLSKAGVVHGDLDREVFRDLASHFKQLDMHLYLEALLRLGEHDARDVLPSLLMPVLILASTHDRMTPVAVAEEMARQIRDCELKVIPGGTHYAAVEFPGLINRHMQEWFGRRFAALQVDAPCSEGPRAA